MSAPTLIKPGTIGIPDSVRAELTERVALLQQIEAEQSVYVRGILQMLGLDPAKVQRWELTPHGLALTMHETVPQAGAQP